MAFSLVNPTQLNQFRTPTFAPIDFPVIDGRRVLEERQRQWKSEDKVSLGQNDADWNNQQNLRAAAFAGSSKGKGHSKTSAKSQEKSPIGHVDPYAHLRGKVDDKKVYTENGVRYFLQPDGKTWVRENLGQKKSGISGVIETMGPRPSVLIMSKEEAAHKEQSAALDQAIKFRKQMAGGNPW